MDRPTTHPPFVAFVDLDDGASISVRRGVLYLVLRHTGPHEPDREIRLSPRQARELSAILQAMANAAEDKGA